MAEIKYKYAYMDKDGEEIISIDELTKDNRKQYNYFCIGCGKELSPRAIGSQYRRPHFYHKEVVECSGETYLHKLTKRIIKKRFYEEPTFFIEYPVTMDCSKNECKYRNLRCRKEFFPYKIDLKKYYDTCTEEELVKDKNGNSYIADILLTNSKNKETEPILIEVCVSHPCDEQKRLSGLRIIEIKIKDESDAIDLEEIDVICEPRFALKRERKVEFISFKREVSSLRQIKLQRYVYEPKLNPKGYLTTIDCDKTDTKLRTDSEVELNVVNVNDYRDCELWAVLFWMAEFKGLRICHNCKFYYATIYEEYPICRLSKKYGKPARPRMDEAVKCRSYYLQEEAKGFFPQKDLIIEEVTSSSLPMKPEYKVILAVSRSFDNYDLFKEKFLYYLSGKIKTCSIVVIGASRLTNEFIDELSKEINFIKEPHHADWGTYGDKAVNVSNDEMTDHADALIAFWDGKSPAIKNLIELAKKKKLKVAIVND